MKKLLMKITGNDRIPHFSIYVAFLFLQMGKKAPPVAE